MDLYTQEELQSMNTELEDEMAEAGAVRFLEQVKNAKQGSKGGKVAMESQTSYGHNLLRDVVDPVAKGLKNFLAIARNKPGVTPEAVFKLSAMEHRTVSYIAAKTILDTITTGEKFTVLCMKIAQKVTDEEYLNMLRSHNKNWYDKLEATMNKAGTVDYHHKVNVFRNMGKKAGIPATDHGYNCLAKMGDVLVNMFRMHTGLIELHKVWEYSQGKQKSITYVYPTPYASQFIEENIQAMQFLHPDCGPNCVPPKIWTNPFNGGYHNPALRKCNPMIHTKSIKQVQAIQERGKFNYRAFNAVVQSEWKINNKVLTLLLNETKNRADWSAIPDSEVFNGLECPLEMPKRTKTANSKAIFKRWYDNLPEKKKDMYKDWKEVSRRLYREDRQRFSKRRQLGTVIRIAKRYSHFEKIYFNCFLDSRGRSYSIGTLSPQGIDYSKALLQAAEPIALGRDGYKWLGLQVTGVYGFDKNSLEERKTWILRHHDILMSIANNPLGDYWKFWSEADKPYQFVAACFEYKNVQDQMAMGIPVELCTSTLIAAQDGSCNGIQHFSAMLKDEIGGKAVNLLPGGFKPERIYQDVADQTLVELSVVKPDEYELARCLVDLVITDKACKRQTMVVPYGGTIQSCKDYSMEWVHERYKELSPTLDAALRKRIQMLKPSSLEQALNILGKYLGVKVWDSLGKCIVGAVQAMKFIQKIQSAVTSGNDKDGQSVEWSTPNGFYVIQDYKDTRPLEVDSRLCGRISMYLQIPTSKIKKSKMRTSISPNYVHSMDAAHMFNTIDLALNKGVKFFACIHDSYGTHLGNSETLAQCIRQSFYEMYAIKDPLRTFYREMARQYIKIDEPNVKQFPKWSEIEKHMGTLNLQDIFDADFFFL